MRQVTDADIVEAASSGGAHAAPSAGWLLCSFELKPLQVTARLQFDARVLVIGSALKLANQTFWEGQAPHAALVMACAA